MRARWNMILGQQRNSSIVTGIVEAVGRCVIESLFPKNRNLRKGLVSTFLPVARQCFVVRVCKSSIHNAIPSRFTLF